MCVQGSGSGSGVADLLGAHFPFRLAAMVTGDLVLGEHAAVSRLD